MIGASGDFIGQIARGNDLSNINYNSVATSSIIGGTSLGLSSFADFSGNYIQSKTINSTSNLIRKLGKNSALSLSLGFDLLLDSAINIYGYQSGLYSLDQAAVNIGVNSAFNLSSFLISSKVAAIVGAKYGGVKGAMAGFALNAVITLGSTFVYDPISTEFKIKNTYEILNSSNKESSIKEWVEQAIGY